MAQQHLVQLTKDVPNLDAYLIGMTHVHASCIEHDLTMATFIPPLSYSKMLNWWNDRFNECLAGSRHIYIELQPISSRKSQLPSPFKDNELKAIRVDQDPDQDYEVAGMVAISMPFSETGPFRAEIEKLLVSPNHRQKGIAKRLMTVLERKALEEGRFNLMVDTVVGTPAEHVYPKLGYTVVGVVPAHGYSPMEQKWTDGVWLYKDLRKGTL